MIMTSVRFGVGRGMLATLALASVSPALGQEADEPAATSQVDPDGPAGGGHATHNLRNYLQHVPETDTLTNHWFGLGDKLNDIGITSTLNLWVTYQANVKGGLSTGDDVNGQYWWGNHFDFERMVGLPAPRPTCRSRAAGTGVSTTTSAH